VVAVGQDEVEAAPTGAGQPVWPSAAASPDKAPVTIYHADYFRTTERQPGAPRLSPLDREMLDAYDDIATTPGIHLEMDFGLALAGTGTTPQALHARDHRGPMTRPAATSRPAHVVGAMRRRPL
jgi:hypothetical protein